MKLFEDFLKYSSMESDDRFLAQDVVIDAIIICQDRLKNEFNKTNEHRISRNA